jgi:hypothetical protein
LTLGEKKARLAELLAIAAKTIEGEAAEVAEDGQKDG